MNPSNEVVSKLTSVKIPEPVISIVSDLVYKMIQASSAPSNRPKKTRASGRKTPMPFEIPVLLFSYYGDPDPIELSGQYVECHEDFGYPGMIVYDFPPY